MKRLGLWRINELRESLVIIFERDVKQINESDLNLLISDKIPEDYQLEYKSELDLSNRDHKRSLLKTVSAFANTNGGLLIYGITEDDNGLPEELIGLSWDNIDEEIRTLTSIIRDRSEPIITIFEPHYFQLEDSENIILMIKIPKSWNAPHRVKINGKKEFYLRIKNKNEPMKIEDLRNNFNLSEILIDRIKEFKERRISELYINETPVPFNGEAKLIIHLIPLNAFNPGQIYNINENERHLNQIRPIGAGGWNHGYNMDGYILFSGNYTDDPTFSYVQFFRNGIFEIVYGRTVQTDEKLISAIYNERAIVEYITNNLDVMKKMNIEMPIFIFITLVNVKDFKMRGGGGLFSVITGSPGIYRKIFTIPEVLIESYDVMVSKSLKTSFNVVWNAFGLPNSESYDNNGEWKF